MLIICLPLSSLHTTAYYAAFNEKNIFYLSHSQVYGVLRRVIRSV